MATRFARAALSAFAAGFGALRFARAAVRAFAAGFGTLRFAKAAVRAFAAGCFCGPSPSSTDGLADALLTTEAE